MSARPFLGQIRHQLVLEAPVDVPDDNGGVTRTYVAQATIYAQIRPLRSRARMRADQAQGLVTHHILFRMRPGLTADMRLRRGARIYDIVALEEFDPLSGFVRAQCQELSP